MITFQEWFDILLTKFPKLQKAFRKKTLDGFLGGKLPTHEQALKIADVVSDGQEIVGNLYIEQMEKILREQLKPNTRTDEYIFMYHPKPAPRPRFTRYGRPYNPKDYTQWKKDFSKILAKLDPQENCTLDIEFHFVSKKAVWGPHFVKPDADNLWKAVGDAFQMAGFVSDDCRFWDVRVRKYYSSSSKIICRITI